MELLRKDNTLCTIVETSYVPYALTVYESIQKWGSDLCFHIFIADADQPIGDISRQYPNICFLTPCQVCSDGIARELYEAYRFSSMDSFRQSMKSALILFLLEKRGFEKVLFLDADLFFYNDFRFLFQALDDYSVLLTPHWRSSIDPYMDYIMFQTIFTDGLFNGGFIGANKHGAEAMHWWAKVCVRTCIIDRTRGLFGDQTYLNLLPVLFDRVLVVKHRGCNVAHWNLKDCPRTLDGGVVHIDHQFDIIFIHFTRSTIEGIINGEDPLLRDHLTEYEATLLRHNAVFCMNNYIRPKEDESLSPAKNKSLIQRIMDVLRIRTRIRKFLEG